MGTTTIPMKKFTSEEDEFIKTNYHQIGLKACATHLCRKPGSVQWRRKYLGLKSLTREEFKHILTGIPKNRTWRVYKVGASQFINVQTPEAAYILGLLWADGYVKRGEKLLVRGVEEDMKDHLVTFERTGEWKVIREEKYRYKIKCKPIITVQTSHISLVEYLETKDYRVKSSMSACKILETIPESLRHYWFRGLLDGDGSVIFKKINTRNRISVAVYSSYEQDWTYLQRLCERLEIRYGIHRGRVIRKDGKINSRSSFTIQNRDGTVKFLNYIYQHVDLDKIGLKRKLLTWKNIQLFMISPESESRFHPKTRIDPSPNLG